MTLNDSIKITELLKDQLKDCHMLQVDGIAFSRDDYERALAVVLEAAKAQRNDQWGH